MKNIIWNLESKIKTWNLLCSIGEKNNHPLSPVITSSFYYLNKYFNKVTTFDFDLLTLCFASYFISYKAEISDTNLNNFIISCANAIYDRSKLKPFTNKDYLLFGSNLENIEFIINKESSDFFKMKGEVIQAETLILTYNNWEFIENHYFEPYNNYIESLKYYLKETHYDFKFYELFRKNSIKKLCLLIINSDINSDYNLMGIISIYSSLKLYPLSQELNHLNWIKIFKINFDIELLEKKIEELNQLQILIESIK